MNAWDKLTVQQRFDVLAYHHPFDARLNCAAFLSAARKAWAELTEHEQERWGSWAQAALDGQYTDIWGVSILAR